MHILGYNGFAQWERDDRPPVGVSKTLQFHSVESTVSERVEPTPCDYAKPECVITGLGLRCGSLK